MPEPLSLKDMYEVVLTDINNLTESPVTEKGKLSEVLTQRLLPKYKGLRCVYCETDYEHHHEFFLTEVEDLSFCIDEKGLQVNVKFNKKGKFVDAYHKIFYELVGEKISRKNLDTLLAKKIQTLGYHHTYKTKPETNLLPKGLRDMQGPLAEEVFLIQDGERFLKVES